MHDLRAVPVEQILEPMSLNRLADRPLVSVVIANYNYAQFIGEAISSVLNQTYQRFEVLICDDGSTDNSCEVIETYARRDIRIKLLRQTNSGVASALNAAYMMSVGLVVCLLDADDAFEPTKIESVVMSFAQNPQAGFCIHKMQPVSVAGKKLGSPVPLELDQGWIGPRVLAAGGSTFGIPTASGISFRREVADQIFPVPLHLKRMCDNYLWRAAISLTEVCDVPAALGKYRLHGGNLTGMPTVSASGILRNLEDIRLVVEAQRQFLTHRYTREIGDCVRMEDSLYWESLLAAFLLSSPRPEGILGRAPSEILAHVPQGLRKHIWRLLLAVPPTLGKRGLQFWWTPASWEGHVRPVLRLLRRCWEPFVRRAKLKSVLHDSSRI